MTETALGTDLSVSSDGDSDGAKQKAAAAASATQEQAGQLASTAKQTAGEVAGTAKDQATQVVGTATGQARSLLTEAQSELSSQAGAQKERAVSGLRALSGDLSSMAEKSEQSGIASHIVAEAAKRSGSFAEFLDEREPGHLLDELRDLGRRRTGAFLLGAAAIGFASGRLLKGARSDAGSSESSGSTGPSPSASFPADPVGATTAPGSAASTAIYPEEPLGPTTGQMGTLAATPHLLPDDNV